ncbi:MAG TPA: amidohydrolase family protein [Acetobacteraceae bacterium]|nr:amidohydrolase family protein [Acetobacteraceae bacterium]
MISRRNTVMIGLGLAAFGAGGASAAETAPTVKTPVDFAVPPGAVDCHVHVFPDPAQFPFWSGRGYTPPVATAAELLALQHALHMDHVVIVTPSVYGTDNRATLDGIRQLGQTRAHGIAVIDENATPADLDALHQAGIRGIRLNLEQAGVFDPAVAARKLDGAAKLLQGRRWHLEMYARTPVIAALSDRFAALSVPVVFDHFAGARAALGPDQPGFAAVLALVKSGKAYVTISGAYRASDRAPDYPDVAPLAKALIATNPERLIWGSDWPHPDPSSVPGRKPTDIAPALPIDDGRVLNLLPEWTSDPAIRTLILVENPKRLYDF